MQKIVCRSNQIKKCPSTEHCAPGEYGFNIFMHVYTKLLTSFQVWVRLLFKSIHDSDDDCNTWNFNLKSDLEFKSDRILTPDP